MVLASVMVIASSFHMWKDNANRRSDERAAEEKKMTEYHWCV